MLTLLPFLVTVITKSQYKFGTLRLIVNLPPPTIIKKQQPSNDAAVLVVFSLHPCKPYKTTTDDQDLLYWPYDLPIRDYHRTRIIIPDQEQKADTLITVHIFSTPSTICFYPLLPCPDPSIRSDPVRPSSSSSRFYFNTADQTTATSANTKVSQIHIKQIQLLLRCVDESTVLSPVAARRAIVPDCIQSGYQKSVHKN